MILNAEADREAFRAHVSRSDAHVNAGDSDAANAEVQAMEAIADRWRAEDRLVEFLTPLLADSETASVRFNAATGLLGAGRSDLAVPVLEALESSKEGLTSFSAGVVLADWRRQNA